jgi:hypothetical protein
MDTFCVFHYCVESKLKKRKNMKVKGHYGGIRGQGRVIVMG